MKTDAKITVIFAIVVAVVLLGEVYVYTISTDRYSSAVYISENGVGYQVGSSGSDIYSVIIMDNGSFEPNHSYYIYYDEGYGSSVEYVSVPVGAKPFTQNYYISQLIKMLEYRGITDVVVVNASELRNAMVSDIENGTFAKGLIVLSGALPDTIYDGMSEDSIIFEWLGTGGRLYWAGNLLGKYVATPFGVENASENYQTLFFGAECLNTSDTDTVFTEVDNQYKELLSLMGNAVKYGVDVSKVTIGRAISMGYTENGYSSISLIEFGDGMICILGGDYSNNQRNDLAQMISSGVCYCSDIIGYVNGSVKRTTIQGIIDVVIPPESNIMAYVYYGGYYPVYGKLTELIK